MSDVKRWSLDKTVCKLFPADTAGGFVRYLDHIKVVKEKDAKIAELESSLNLLRMAIDGAVQVIADDRTSS